MEVLELKDVRLIPWDDKTLDILNIVFIAVFSTLSCIASLSLAVTIVTMKPLRTKLGHLIFILSVMDFLGALAYVVSYLALLIKLWTGWWPDWLENIVCNATAYSIQFFYLCGDHCVACVGLYLFVRIVLRVSSEKWLRVVMVLLHLLIWVPNIIYFGLGLVFDVYGKAGHWCWIRPEKGEFRIWLYFGAFYMLVALNVVLSVVLVATVHIRARKKMRAAPQEPLRKRQRLQRLLIQKIALYFVASVLVRSYAAFNRTFQTVTNMNVQMLSLIQAITTPGQGVVNVAGYTIGQNLHISLWHAIRRRIRGEKTPNPNDYITSLDDTRTSMGSFMDRRRRRSERKHKGRKRDKKRGHHDKELSNDVNSLNSLGAPLLDDSDEYEDEESSEMQTYHNTTFDDQDYDSDDDSDDNDDGEEEILFDTLYTI